MLYEIFYRLLTVYNFIFLDEADHMLHKDILVHKGKNIKVTLLFSLLLPNALLFKVFVDVVINNKCDAMTYHAM